ncbi:MAG: protein-disulfide reductase [Proteobacteria bacterium]|nr:protein-disulfide reductase [Pseudomonadota bacterium]
MGPYDDCNHCRLVGIPPRRNLGLRVCARRSRSIVTGLLLLLGVILLDGRAWAAASAWDSHEHGAARLITATEATGSDRRLDVGLQLRLTPGWHTYWRSPGDAGIAPTIDWKGSRHLASATIAWPAPQRLPPLGGLETLGYVGGVVLPITITLTHPGEALHLHAEVDYASCKQVCIPYHASLDLALPPGLARPGPQAPLIAAAQARVPGDARAAALSLTRVTISPDEAGALLSVRLASIGKPFRALDLFVEGAGDASPRRPVVTLAEDGRLAMLRVPIHGATAAKLAGTPLRLTIVDGTRAAEMMAKPIAGTLPRLPDTSSSRLAILGMALLGGLILNLMPCVLPVLSLKLLALAGYGGMERRAARSGLLATAAGILVSFAVIAAALIGLKEAGGAIGWGIQFQSPWFLAAMALATTLFAASLWEWLPITLPGGTGQALGAARGQGPLSDAFLIGAFATLLATSCSAPFLGTAIGFALARGPGDIALVFAGLGVGMAAPFLAVAAAPGLVAWLPRPGPWMVWLRRVLGVILLATAAWLLSVLATEAGLAAALLAGGALVLLLCVLAWRHHRAARRLAATGAAITLAAIAILVPGLQAALNPQETLEAAARAGPWQPFRQAALHDLVVSGHVVLVDVTAAWCLTCKVNELTVLDRPPVAGRLRAPGVVAMRADWTRPDPAITAYLQSFGRYGVPLDVVYGPGAPDGIALPELLSAQAVMEAFRRAGPPAKEAER